MPAGCAGESELDQLLGERRAFSRIADSCSAADAECLRRMREEKLYLTKNLNWAQFCTRYLDISKAEANRIIQRFDEFGDSYFDVSRIVRISPESYRAIAHAVRDNAIEYNGETIALIPENSQRVAAAVQALRQTAAPKPAPKAALKPAAPQPAPVSQVPVYERINALERRAYELTAELRQVCQETNSGQDRQTIQRLAHDLRQRMYDLEVLAA
jgi:CRISPR/Cas system-associated endoribonuclease Cas2